MCGCGNGVGEYEHVSLYYMISCTYMFLSIMDYVRGVTVGILRGSGRQSLGALLNFFCYYMIGLPLGIFLAFASRLGTLGIWIGLAIADGLQVCLMYVQGKASTCTCIYQLKCCRALR